MTQHVLHILLVCLRLCSLKNAFSKVVVATALFYLLLASITGSQFGGDEAIPYIKAGEEAGGHASLLLWTRKHFPFVLFVGAQGTAKIQGISSSHYQRHSTYSAKAMPLLTKNIRHPKVDSVERVIAGQKCLEEDSSLGHQQSSATLANRQSSHDAATSTPTTPWIIDLDTVAAIDEEHDHSPKQNEMAEHKNFDHVPCSKVNDKNNVAVEVISGVASATTGDMSEEDDEQGEYAIFQEQKETNAVIELSPLINHSVDSDDNNNNNNCEMEDMDDERTFNTASTTFFPLLQLRGGGRSSKKLPAANSISASPSKRSETPSSSSSSSVFVGSVFNLVNNVAGAGILTLAAGKATGTGWIPSILICASLAALSAHTFTLVGKACDLSGEQDFAGLWARAFGPESSYIVSLIVSLQGTTSQIIYIGMIGEVFSALFQMIGITFMDRTKCILLMSTVALWPMCLLRDLSSLAFTSILGFSAVMYTVLFIVVRALDGSYDVSRDGKFVSTSKDISTLAAAAPSFEKSSWWNIDFASLILMSNLGLAYIAHYNAPTYWREMKHKLTKQSSCGSKGETSTLDVSKIFSNMVRTSYGILAMIYVAAMCGGYYTFGDTCLGNILMNYHPNDILSTLGRVATGWSIVFGFPLVHNGAREGLKSFTQRAFGWTALSNPENHSILATCYLIFVTTVAIIVKDVRIVVGLAGAAFGSFLVYICPVWIYLMIMRSLYGPQSKEYGIAKRNNLLIIPFGLFCGSMGVTMTLKEAFKRAAMEATTS